MHVEDVKRSALRAMDVASVKYGSESEVPGLREAVEALPDRRLLSRLAPEVRRPIEEALAETT